MLVDHNLRDHPITAVTRLLDSQISSSIRDRKHQQLRAKFGLIASCKPNSFNGFAFIVDAANNGGILVLNFAAMTLVCFDKLLNEVLGFYLVTAVLTIVDRYIRGRHTTIIKIPDSQKI